jgi:ABC-type Na+ efflux pump permease subunit
VSGPGPRAPDDDRRGAVRTARGRAGREVRAIATLEALDGIRARRALVLRTVTPILLFLCVLGVTIALRGADTRAQSGRYRVAVAGDAAGARATLDALAGDRLAFFPAADARLATIESADAGMRVPDGLDDAVRAGAIGAVTVELFEITVNPPSRAAVVLVRSGLADLRAREVADGRRARAAANGLAAGDTPPVGTFTVEAVNVERTIAGTRTITSQVIPGLVCLQAALLVAGTANRLASRRTRGILTAQLLLPVSRRRLAIAKGLGELLVGLVTSSPVVLAILGFGAVVAVRAGSPLRAVVGGAATATSLVVLFALTTAVGVLIGTAARTPEQVSLATGGAVIGAALVASVVALGPADPPAGIAVVPFAGVVGALRQILNEGGSPALFVVATASTALGALAVSVLAGRLLDAERMVMRDG